MEIVVVRHGEPDWEPGGRAMDDPELTPLGHEQAERVAETLGDEHFDGFYVSPLRRARETAAPIAKRLGREPQVESWLREIRLPEMQGKTSDEVQQFFRAARARELEKWWDGMAGGESFRHMHERVSAGIEGLLIGDHAMRIHEDSGHRIWARPEATRRLLIVAHEGTNAVILSHLLGIAPVPWEWMRFSSAWAGISRLRGAEVASGAIWVLDAFNRIHHLRGLAKLGEG